MATQELTGAHAPTHAPSIDGATPIVVMVQPQWAQELALALRLSMPWEALSDGEFDRSTLNVAIDRMKAIRDQLDAIGWGDLTEPTPMTLSLDDAEGIAESYTGFACNAAAENRDADALVLLGLAGMFREAVWSARMDARHKVKP